MRKRSLADLDRRSLDGQRVVVRCDLNVPLKDGVVADDTRIRASLPTIKFLREQGARVVVLSHLGRPGGKVEPSLSLRPVARALEDALGSPVAFLEDPAGDDAASEVRHLPRGGVALGENTRFYPGEEANEDRLADAFASLGQLYVNDAFGSAHRGHASTEAIAHRLKPAVSGFLMERELRFLGLAIESPKRPFVAILGGAKISGKIDLIEALLPKVDRILIGGAMAGTFFKAMGLETGGSLVEDDRLAMARALLAKAGEKLVLPSGALVGDRMESGAATMEVPREDIEQGWAMYDIDSASTATFADLIMNAGTVLWNGPMGVFEIEEFSGGTLGVARAVAAATEGGAVTVVGGGDSAAALTAAGLADRVTHLSTGGGASLEFLEGRELPGVAALDDLT